MFRRNRDRKDKDRNENVAAMRIRSIGSVSTFRPDADADAVAQRLRNMTYGSTDSRVAATRGV